MYMFKYITFLLLTLAIPSLLSAQPIISHQKTEWTPYQPILELEGLNGQFIGRYDYGLIIAGGVKNGRGQRDAMIIFPDMAEKRVFKDFFKYTWAMGASVNMEDGVVFVGGLEDKKTTARVTKVWWNATEDSLNSLSIPDLPAPNAYLTVAMIKDRLYAFSGYQQLNSNAVEQDIWMLDLSVPPIIQKWRSLGSYPGLPRIDMVSAVQGDGDDEDHIFLFGGKNLASEQVEWIDSTHSRITYKGTPKSDQSGIDWTRVADMPLSITPGSAASIGESHIVVFGDQAHEQRGVVMAYHTVTDTWLELESISSTDGGASALPIENSILFIGDMIQKNENKSNIWKVTFNEKSPDRSNLALGLVGIYFLGMFLFTLYYRKPSANPGDFFTASGQISAGQAGISIAATYISATLLLSTISKVYSTTWVLLPGISSLFLTLWFVNRYYLPFFRRLEITSIYTYLEYRYNILMRLFADFSFIGFHFIQLSLMIYLPASALSFIGGWSLILCISGMGLIATAYIYIGGIRQIIRFDRGQVICLVGGLSVIIIWSILDITSQDGGMAGVYRSGKMALIQNSWLSKDLSLWVVLLGAMTIQLGLFTSDQSISQKFLVTADENTARKSIWVSGWLIIGITLLFFILGTCIFGLYLVHPEWLTVGQDNTAALSNLTAHHLPPFISSMVIICLISAAMSSFDSSLHSISTVVTIDLIQRFNSDLTEERLVGIAKKVVVLIGLFSTLTAVIMSQIDITTIFRIAGSLVGLIFSSLTGIFILGIFTERARASGVMMGVFSSMSVMVYLAWLDVFHLYLVPFIGLCTCVIIGYIVSLIIPTNPVDLRGLTIHSLKKNAS